MRNELTIIRMVTLLVLLLAGSLRNLQAATELFAVDFFSGSFVKLDKTNGAVTFISTPGSGVNGLAWNANTRTMLLLKEDVSLPPSARVPTLFDIDPLTGSTSFPRPVGFRLTGLTYNPAFSVLYSTFFASSSTFWSLNPSTGQTSLIGSLQIEQAIDLTTDSRGTIWGGTFNGEIFTVNTNTGLATRQFSIGTGLTALAFDEADNLFAVTLTQNNLIQINTNNGSFTTLGGTGLFDIRGMVFADLNPLPPPPRVKIRFSEVEICWDALSNVTYTVEYRSTLTTNDTWQVLFPCILGQGAAKQVYDHIALGEPQRYYRVVATNCVVTP
jgi:hypothetical protein